MMRSSFRYSIVASHLVTPIVPNATPVTPQLLTVTQPPTINTQLIMTDAMVEVGEPFGPDANQDT
jgi:hypothetical protein